MTEIKLRADEARGMAARVRQEASDAKQQVESLRSYLTGLTDSFTGRSQMAFDEAFNNWQQGARQMLDGLDGLGEFLKAAADTIDQADIDIANKLGG